jgi:YesN/AraC family two-component response regulator
MSATALKGYVRNADAVGMNGYITKPVRREDLENVLQKVAGNQVATGSVAGAVLEES